MAILNLNLNNRDQREEVKRNTLAYLMALHSDLHKADREPFPKKKPTPRKVVSTDFGRFTSRGGCDAEATICNDTRLILCTCWYDNEFGYSCQVVRIPGSRYGSGQSAGHSRNIDLAVVYRHYQKRRSGRLFCLAREAGNPSTERRWSHPDRGEDNLNGLRARHWPTVGLRKP